MLGEHVEEQGVPDPAGFPEIWGNSGSSGSFMYYCEALDLYMIGTADFEPFYAGPFDFIIAVMLKRMGAKG